MNQTYSVPKIRVRADVLLPGRISAKLTLFLSDRAEHHEGHERPSDLLNGALAFIPAMNELEEVVLLGHDNLMVVSVSAGDEFSDAAQQSSAAAPFDVTCHSIKIVLLDGTTLSGEVSYLMPESQRRLQDYLNNGERFLSLREAGIVHLVNKLQIVQISRS